MDIEEEFFVWLYYDIDIIMEPTKNQKIIGSSHYPWECLSWRVKLLEHYWYEEPPTLNDGYDLLLELL